MIYKPDFKWNKKNMVSDKSNKKMFNILVLEFVERFAFYSFNAVFVLYVSHYFLTEAQTYMLFGVVLAAIYGASIMGGLVADKLLGIKRTLVVGMVGLAIGYCLLFFAYFSFRVCLYRHWKWVF